MLASEFNAVSYFSGHNAPREVVATIMEQSFPGIDNQMRAPDPWGPFMEFPYSDAFLEADWAIQSEMLCPGGEHDWEDDSYGGPESGCMAGHCTRCGHSFHHTLY